MLKYLFGQSFGLPQSAQGQPSDLNRALYNFLNNELPIINEDGFDYVNRGFMSVGPVYEAVDLISKKIAKMPVIVYKVVDESKLRQSKNLIQSDNPSDRAKALQLKASALQEVKVDSIQRVLERPNEKQSWTDFVGMIAHLYLIDGNAFVYGNGANNSTNKFKEMFALPFTSKEMNIVSGGVFDPVKGYNVVWNGSTMSFPNPNQILHLKTINPRYSMMGSQMYGVSPLKAYTYQLVRDRLGNAQANKILKNGGLFGMLAPKHSQDTLSKDQKTDLKERITEAHASNSDIARIFPMSVAMEWLQFGLPIADLAILDLMKTTREDIYQAYHIPLTYASTDGATYNNITTSGKMLMYNAVVPVSDYIGEKLTEWLCAPYKDAKYIIELDYLSSPELTADMGEVVKWLEKADMLTPNEKREVMRWGRIEDELMNKVYMSKQKAPIEKL